MNVNEFIKELQNLSEEKRELPILMQAPNGIEFTPKIKMKFENYGSSLFGDKLEAIHLNYE